MMRGTQFRRSRTALRYSRGTTAVDFDSRHDPVFQTPRDVPLLRDYCGGLQNEFYRWPEDWCRYLSQQADYRRRVAIGYLVGEFHCLSNEGLFRMRDARYVAGLGVGDCDEEIARRVLLDPEGFGWLGMAMEMFGFGAEMEDDPTGFVFR